MVDIHPLIEMAHKELSVYISGVTPFIESLGKDGQLEKTSLRSKTPDQYIRNMLAIGVISAILRQEFLKTDKKVLVLPDCLKNYSDIECSKEFDGNEYTCTQCNPDCLIFEIMDRYDDGNNIIVLEPDETEKYIARIKSKHGTVGVIGIACALTLLSGFHATLKYKLPTQGIFLNYASCKHHWIKDGANSSFSFHRLDECMNSKFNYDPDPPRGRGPTYSLEYEPFLPENFYKTLDNLSRIFESEYMPLFKKAFPELDIFDLSIKISNAIVPDLITRDSS